ncbi:MAG: outer membrane beta-barrel protein [Gemmatimonadales bacterium]
MRVAAAMFVVAGAMALPAAQAKAQLFYFGVRGGAGIPTGSFAQEGNGDSNDAFLRGATPGLGYGLDAGTALGPFGIYAGADRIDFGCADASCAASGKYKLEGVSAGARLSVPLMPLLKPWVKAGLTYNKLDGTLGGSSGAKIVTDRALGYEVGAGVDIPVLMGFFSLTPQLRYVRQKLNYRAETLSPPLRGKKPADYYTFDIGLRFRSPL